LPYGVLGMGIGLFVLARKTRETVHQCNVIAERRTDIVNRYRRLSIVAAVILAAVILWLVVEAGIDFFNSTSIPSWIGDTILEFFVMVFCVIVLFSFRLSAGEDLNLINLLPLDSDDLNLPQGVLPDGPSAYLDEEEIY
jgi:hypothetical protein